VPRADIFAQTGLQFMQFNTLFQLLAHQQQAPRVLDSAHRLLFTPDFLHWCLCGSQVAEYTIASTSQCLHPARRTWATALLKQFGLPTHLFPKLVQPGTALGMVRASVQQQTGLGQVRVVAPPSHDTASAVAGVPTAHTGSGNWAYLSSGTWSLMGVETRHPSLTPRTLELNFTNEGGVDGTIRLLKNIMGLWLVQRCKRAFDTAGKTHTYPELEALAVKAGPLRSLVNPNDPRFLNPLNMPAAIQEFCRETRQPAPRTKGEIVRCAKESLALKYAEVVGHLEELTGTRLEVVHIVGGGSKDTHLNQMTADACQRPVLAGPVEATGLGNLLTQVRAHGELSSLGEMRDVVRTSTNLTRFDPRDSTAWVEAGGRFASLSHN
jgi:rhamnulokinase